MKLPCSTITGSPGAGPEVPGDPILSFVDKRRRRKPQAGHSLVLLNMSGALKLMIGLAYRDMQIKLMGSTSLFLRCDYE